MFFGDLVALRMRFFETMNHLRDRIASRMECLKHGEAVSITSWSIRGMLEPRRPVTTACLPDVI